MLRVGVGTNTSYISSDTAVQGTHMRCDSKVLSSSPTRVTFKKLSSFGQKKYLISFMLHFQISQLWDE